VKKFPKHPKYRCVYDLSIVLERINLMKLTVEIAKDKILVLEFWQRKTTILLAIYCLLGPHEINSIMINNMVIEKMVFGLKLLLKLMVVNLLWFLYSLLIKKKYLIL
jgi:hypothetical protein